MPLIRPAAACVAIQPLSLKFVVSTETISAGINLPAKRVIFPSLRKHIRGQVRLLVTSKPVMTVDPAFYRAAGLEPADAQIVVVKSHIQFRAGYADLAKEIILLDSPGMSSDHLESLPFHRVPRPLFPLDRQFDWSPAAGEC